VNEILYADDTAIIRNDRDSLTKDLKLTRTILREFCMEMHEGTPGGKPSKTECVYFAKQPSRYADNKTFDDVDLSPIILDDATGSNVPFVKKFTYLGAQVDEHLDDMVEVDTRVQKASCAFGRFRQRIFCNTKITKKTKAMLYLALCTSTALYGCESWSVKVNMEKRLQSLQTRHCAAMLGLTLSFRIQIRVTAKSMRDKMGLRSCITIMRTLQLNWLGQMRRMDKRRRPRQLITCWLSDRRKKNYNQSYSSTMRKALKSIEISEDEWQDITLSGKEWSHYITQTKEDRIELREKYKVSERGHTGLRGEQQQQQP
jgi:hypothetical protein